MKKLKKMKIDMPEVQREINVLLRKNLPHLTIIEDWEQDKIFTPADPYAKFSPDSGFWEISCKPVSLFSKRY